MTTPTSESSSPPWKRAVRFIHGLFAFTAAGIGLPLALIGGMAMLGSVSDNPWVRLAPTAVVLLVVPLLLADRLLPKDPNERRPGLVRDVLASSWAASALVFVALAPSFTGTPLRAEADRLDTSGWTQVARVGRFMAGPDPDPAPADELTTTEPTTEPTTATPDTELAVATTKPGTEPKPKPEAGTEPESTGETGGEGGDKPGDKSGDKPGDKPEPVPDPDHEYSPAELFRAYAPAVVAIKINRGPFSSGGTGFFVDTAGTIATNHHVINDAAEAGEVRVKLFDGTELTKVELLVSDREVDLALLRIDPSALSGELITTLLGDSEAVQVGEPVSVIGNPLGLDHTLTNGIVSARRVYEGERYIQMSAPISPGNSGGPVFDRHGRVIGVSVAQMIGGQNLNLAVPVSQLQAMIAEDYPNRRGFGVSSW